MTMTTTYISARPRTVGPTHRMRLAALCCALALLASAPRPGAANERSPADGSRVDTAQASRGKTPGTTVITHGFQFGDERPDWPLLMAAEIAERMRADGGAARVLEFHPDQEPALTVCTNTALCGTSDPSGHAIIAFDWAALSSKFGRGFSESAGEALAAVLLAEQAQLDLTNLHFIGHSRGPVVNSEAAERLIAAGLQIEQMTVLDPHDWGAAPRSDAGVELVPESLHAGSRATDRDRSLGEGRFFGEGSIVDSAEQPAANRGGLDDFDVNELHPEYDCGPSQGGPSAVCAWSGIGYVDNYYQADGLFDLRGRAQQGASNLHFDGLDMGHSEVHCWYRATVSGSVVLAFPGAGCDEGALDSDWFTSASICSAVDRSTPMSRATDGYNFALAADGISSRCPDGTPRQTVLFDVFTSEGLVNGDFEKASDAGWSGNGGQAEGELLQQSDNWFVRLSDGDEHRHSWSPVPADAWSIDLSFSVTVADLTAELVLFVVPYGDVETELQRIDLSQMSGAWQELSVRLPLDLLGKTVRFGVRNVAMGSSVAEVDVDDFGYSPVPVGLLFADGFETGSTSAWSP